MLLLAVKDCWPHSPAVIAACKAAIEKLIEERAVELAASYLWKDLLGRLSTISERDDADLVTHIARHAGPHIALMGSSMLFDLARPFGTQLLVSADAPEAIQFTPDRFEQIATETKP